MSVPAKTVRASYVPIVIDMEAESLARLNKHCARVDRPRARVIRRAIDEYLERVGAVSPAMPGRGGKAAENGKAEKRS